MKTTFRASLPQIIISSIILFLGLIIFFPFPRLFVVILIISVISVLITARIIKKWADKRAIRLLHKLSKLTDEQLREWSLKQYNLINKVILFCALFFLLLTSLGFSMKGILISEKFKDNFVKFIAYFGAGIAALGIYLICICLYNLILRRIDRDLIVDETIKSVKEELEKFQKIGDGS
jgi:hypothetical protein